MKKNEAFVDSLSVMKAFLLSNDPSIEVAVEKATADNPWFMPEFVRESIRAIANQFLDKERYVNWRNLYPESSGISKRVAIVMAGNIPLVGFHDLFCVLASGNKAIIKLSDKDELLLTFLLQKWIEIFPSLADKIEFAGKLDGFDAVIATGSNNSSRYFEYYFKSYPHILRRNRNGIAVLDGTESQEELRGLGKDIFMYFGLGCRNVSKIYIPVGYDFTQMQEVFEDWKYLSDHNKYRNNLDYNYAIYLINSVPHINFGHLILKEDAAIASRIGCVHYEYYNDFNQLTADLTLRKDEIQCVVSKVKVEGWENVKFGDTQMPSLNQYADGVDTMKFLFTL